MRVEEKEEEEEAEVALRIVMSCCTSDGKCVRFVIKALRPTHVDSVTKRAEESMCMEGHEGRKASSREPCSVTHCIALPESTMRRLSGGSNSRRSAHRSILHIIVFSYRACASSRCSSSSPGR